MVITDARMMLSQTKGTNSSSLSPSPSSLRLKLSSTLCIWGTLQGPTVHRPDAPVIYLSDLIERGSLGKRRNLRCSPDGRLSGRS